MLLSTVAACDQVHGTVCVEFGVVLVESTMRDRCECVNERVQCTRLVPASGGGVRWTGREGSVQLPDLSSTMLTSPCSHRASVPTAPAVRVSYRLMASVGCECER